MISAQFDSLILTTMALTIDLKTNPDLTEERKKVEFNVEEFTNWFYGGEDKVQEKRFLGEIRNSTIRLH